MCVVAALDHVSCAADLDNTVGCAGLRVVSHKMTHVWLPVL